MIDKSNINNAIIAAAERDFSSFKDAIADDIRNSLQAAIDDKKKKFQSELFGGKSPDIENFDTE